MDKRIPFWRCGLAALLLLALTAFSTHAQMRIPVTFGDIEITLQSVPQGSSGHGYSEYVFRVRNQSAERPHTVTLSIPFEKYHRRGDSIRDLRRTVQVGANETARLTLLQPDYPPIDGSNVGVQIDGQQQQRYLDMKPHESNYGYRSRRGRIYSSYSTSPYSGAGAPLLLIDARIRALPVQPVEMPSGPIMMSGPGGGGMSGGGRRIGVRTPPAAATLRVGKTKARPGLPPNSHQPVNPEPVEIWSSHWLAYSRYDGVMVSADELKAMPAGVRTALWQYVETGGCLFVIGPADLSGLSAVTEALPDGTALTTIYAGFGQCIVSPDANYEKWSANDFQKLSEAWKKIASSWMGGQRSTAEANTEFPIVNELGIPVKGLFVLMFLFTLAIGPVNLLLLMRLKRRIWMLWTTPLISLATCLAVFGYMLISEGWEGQLRTETLTLLDETTHRAMTVGWTGVYSPLTPGDGLHFSYDTEVIPQHYFEDDRGGGRSCTLDWSQDQHLASGWVEARVPAHFKVRKSELRRERVALHQEADGRWSMVNGLGAAIRRFWYADAKGQIHQAENIAAGARALLTLTETETQPATTNGWSTLSSVSWMSQMKALAEKPERYLHPGNYLAEVDDSPFLEDALHHAKKRKTHALIVGFRQRGE